MPDDVIGIRVVLLRLLKVRITSKIRKTIPDRFQVSLEKFSASMYLFRLIHAEVINAMVFHRVGEIIADKNSGKTMALLYGDLQGKAVGREVELSNSTLLGREILTIPGIGNLVAIFIGRGSLIVVIGVILIIVFLIPWEQVYIHK